MNKLLMKAIPAAALRKGLLPFAVYTSGPDDRTTLLTPAGTNLEFERDELITRHGWQVYIDSVDENLWYEYAGATIDSLIHSHLIRFDDKAEVVLSLLTRSFSALWEEPSKPAHYATCSAATRSLVDLILHSKERTGAFFTNLENDRYVLSHAVNVSSLAVLIGEILYGKDRDVLWKVGLAGLLHDIGIATIDPGVLHRAEVLNDDDWARMTQHPAAAASLAERAGLPAATLLAIAQHHERADGSGYPEGRSLADIHPYARIIAVADVYDAITSDRSYREGRRHVEALREMARSEATFDPACFDALLLIVLNNDRLVDEFRRGVLGGGA